MKSSSLRMLLASRHSQKNGKNISRRRPRSLLRLSVLLTTSARRPTHAYSRARWRRNFLRGSWVWVKKRKSSKLWARVTNRRARPSRSLPVRCQIPSRTVCECCGRWPSSCIIQPFLLLRIKSWWNERPASPRCFSLQTTKSHEIVDNRQIKYTF
eukprot:19753_3